MLFNRLRLQISGQSGDAVTDYRRLLPWVILVIVIVTSRLPFLGNGYGNDPDAWRVVIAARDMATGGEYVASRLPGYPIQEFACALLWSFGPWVLNGLTMIFSTVGIVFFGLILKKYRTRDYLIVATAFSFLPVIYINSVNLMDYLWALSFILASYYFILAHRSVAAGILLGLATGCRITSLLLLFPLSLIVWHQAPSHRRHKESVKYVLATVITAFATFLPVIAKYGTGFVDYAKLPYPPWRTILDRGIVNVWGKIAIVALVSATILTVLRRFFVLVKRSRSIRIPDSDITACLMTIIIYWILFLWLPIDSGYLIPTLPFMILLFSVYFSRNLLIILCMSFLISPFVDIDRYGLHPGPIIQDHFLREKGVKFAREIVHKSNSLDQEALIVAGYWLPKIQTIIPGSSSSEVRFTYSLDAQQASEALEKGIHVYFLPNIRQHNQSATGVDLVEFGGKLLKAD